MGKMINTAKEGLKENETRTKLNEDFRYMKIHIFALRWRDEKLRDPRS